MAVSMIAHVNKKVLTSGLLELSWNKTSTSSDIDQVVVNLTEYSLSQNIPIGIRTQPVTLQIRQRFWYLKI